VSHNINGTGKYQPSKYLKLNKGRRSGGGAVYQDLGNLVFSFLLPHDSSIDFKTVNTNILINAFGSLGIDAHFSGRNDILVEDKKVIYCYIDIRKCF
jgi:hypothetical protein